MRTAAVALTAAAIVMTVGYAQRPGDRPAANPRATRSRGHMVTATSGSTGTAATRAS